MDKTQTYQQWINQIANNNGTIIIISRINKVLPKFSLN